MIDAFFAVAVPLFVVSVIVATIFLRYHKSNPVYADKEGEAFRDALNKKLNRHVWVIAAVFMLIYGLVLYALFDELGLSALMVILGIYMALPVFTAWACFIMFYLGFHHLVAGLKRKKT